LVRSPAEIRMTRGGGTRCKTGKRAEICNIGKWSERQAGREASGQRGKHAGEACAYTPSAEELWRAPCTPHDDKVNKRRASMALIALAFLDSSVGQLAKRELKCYCMLVVFIMMLCHGMGFAKVSAGLQPAAGVCNKQQGFASSCRKKGLQAAGVGKQQGLASSRGSQAAGAG
jgi:hypothetical protein